MPTTYELRYQVQAVESAEYGVTIHEVIDLQAADAFDVVGRYGDQADADAAAAKLNATVTTGVLTMRSGIVNPIGTVCAPAGHGYIETTWYGERFWYLFPFDGNTVTGPAVGRARWVADGLFSARRPNGDRMADRVAFKAAFESLV